MTSAIAPATVPSTSAAVVTGIRPAPPSAPIAPADKSAETQIAAAKLALANANSQVDTDKRDHSPSCVATDEKLVDKANVALAQAQAQLQSDAVLDITV